MRLISVQAILDIELGKFNPGVKIIQNFSDVTLRDTEYSILSHCWGADDEEVMLKEMVGLAKMGNEDMAELRQRFGYQKIVKTCEQARMDGVEWVWVDTCCIDKESSAELSEAINSMYRWYRNAGKCYAYIHDVHRTALPAEQDFKEFGKTDGWPKWFSRGWTLQELIAPKDVIFFNGNWESLGRKTHLAPTLSKITGVPDHILQYGLESNRPCAAQIMSWASSRTTTREEDRAYSLMGFFGIYMPMLYGEGKHAFRRLQLEILRTTNDHSIFAWYYQAYQNNVLADGPECFWNCRDTVRMEAEEYRETIKQMIPEEQFRLIAEDQLRTCSVTNGGIEIWLPVRRISGLPILEATLACRNQQGPQSIELALYKSQYYRYLTVDNDYGPGEFLQLFLAYTEEIGRNNVTFKIDSDMLQQEGFVQSNGGPDDTVTLKAEDHRLVRYHNPSTNIRFLVFLGSLFGSPWVYLAFPGPQFEFDPWFAGPGLVEALHSATLGRTMNAYCLIKHLHLPNTPSGIQLTYQRLPELNSHLLTLAVTPCTALRCPSSDTWKAFDSIPVLDKGIFSHAKNVLLKDINHTLLVDKTPVTFMQTLEEPGFELGDYGHWNNESFTPEGNIFKDLHDSNIYPLEQVVSDQWGNTERVSFGSGDSTLILQQLRGWSVPDNARIRDLLRALLTHTKGKCLVTTVVQCVWCIRKNEKPESWERPPVLTPLCILTQPLIWYEEGETNNSPERVGKVGSTLLRRILGGRTSHRRGRQWIWAKSVS